MNRIIFLSIVIFSCLSNIYSEIKLPVPRFVSIKFDEVNARSGAANDCPIEWIYTKKGEPVEVIAEFELWRKIRDFDNQGGWVHSSVISGNRYVVIKTLDNVNLYSDPNENSKILAYLKANIRCKLNKIKTNWCQITCDKYKGWVTLNNIWGVYPHEK